MIALLRRLRAKLNREPDLASLVRRGLRLGRNVNVLPGVEIDHSHCWLVSIGDETTIAPNVQIVAHDASTKIHLGYTRIARVTIGRRVFVGAGSIVLPGVTIGDDAIVAAGTVVTRDVGPGVVVAGNPARDVGRTTEYVARQRALLATRRTYGKAGWTEAGGIDAERRRRQWDELEQPGFVE